MPFFDFIKSRLKKKSHEVKKETPAETKSKGGSKRQIQEDPNGQQQTSQMDYTQFGTAQTAVNPTFITKQRTKRKKDDKFHKPVTQIAEDVRTRQSATLQLEDLHWFSGGVFSNVYRGRLVAPEKMEIAIKKTWPKDSVRSDEMIILAAMRRASPRNIIKLLYIFKNKASDDTECEAFIFAFMPETLDKVIRRGLTPIDMKIYIWQLFNGLDFLAANRIAHRDIKPINILVNRDSGELQIGDFGSAKVISSRERSSSYQVTRYYRPPEMLLGSRSYSHLIDVWSAGCVLGEMIKGRVLFRGSDSDHQMQLIQAAFGPPNDEQIKAMKVKNVKLKNINKYGLLTALRLQGENSDPSRLTPTIQAAVGLLKKVLVYVPENRLCGKEFLEDTFFDDVMSPSCVRENGRRPDLQRQSDDTMCHQCFERSQKSVKESRVSRVADPPDKEEQTSTKQTDQVTCEQKHGTEDEGSVDKDMTTGPAKTEPHLVDMRTSGQRKQ